MRQIKFAHFSVSAWIGLLALGASAASGCTSSEPDGGDGDGDKGQSSTGGMGDGGAPPDGTGGRDPVTASGCEEPTGEGTDVGSSITSDETWDYAGSPYRISFQTAVTATLTLEPCTVVELEEGTHLYVGNDPEEGEIIAHGEVVGDAGEEVVRPVIFRPLTTGTYWGQIGVDPTGRLDFEYVRLLGGGSMSASSDGGGTIISWGTDPAGEPHKNILVSNVEIIDSETYGINLQARAAFDDGSTSLTIRDSGSDASPEAIFLEAGVARTLPENLVLEGNERDEVLVNPFTRVQEDTFPYREGVVYRVNDWLYVAPQNGDEGVATLTIEPGVEIKFVEGAGSGITMGADETHQGQLVAEGTAARPIWLHSGEESPAAGDWMGLYFAHYPATGNVVEYVTIEDAGAFNGANGYGCGPADNSSAIFIRDTRPSEVFVRNSTFKNTGSETQLALGFLSDAPAADAAAYLAENTFEGSPACAVSYPESSEAPLCPGNDGEPDCL